MRFCKPPRAGCVRQSGVQSGLRASTRAADTSGGSSQTPAFGPRLDDWASRSERAGTALQTRSERYEWVGKSAAVMASVGSAERQPADRLHRNDLAREESACPDSESEASPSRSRGSVPGPLRIFSIRLVST